MNQNTQAILKVLVILLVLMFVGLLLVKRLVYFKPSSLFLETVEKYQEVHHRHLHGRFLDNPNSDRAVLFCHGNAGNVSQLERTVVALRDLGMSVLAFDYSGFGKSKGVPSEQQLYDDASSMLALLQERYGSRDIVVYGESMGGPVAAYVALRHAIPYLILDSPLPSIRKIIRWRYPYLSWLGPLFSEFDTVKYLGYYGGKSLLLHSREDTVIPYDTVEDLAKLCTEHIVTTGPHLSSSFPTERMRTFLGIGKR